MELPDTYITYMKNTPLCKLVRRKPAGQKAQWATCYRFAIEALAKNNMSVDNSQDRQQLVNKAWICQDAGCSYMETVAVMDYYISILKTRAI